MHSRRARYALIGFSLLFVVGTGLFLWNLHRHDRDLTTAQREVLAHLEAMSAAVNDIAAAQQAYVLAPNDVDDSWLARVSSLIGEVSDETAALGPLARSSGSGDALRTLADATAALDRVDTRARQNLARRGQTGRDLLAEGHDILDSMLVELRNLRFSEAAAFEAAHAALHGQVWLLFGAMALVWMGGLFLLAQAPLDLPVDLGLTATEVPVPAAPPTEVPVAPRTPSLDLGRAAQVCTTIARVTTADGLRTALGEAAEALRSPGLVVWIEADGALTAAVTHGYDEAWLDRLGAVTRDGQNVTAAAWRSGEVRTWSGDAASTSAIAVPLAVHPSQPFGVLTAEIPTGCEDDVVVRAVTSMFAAQLTSLLGHASPGAQLESPADEPWVAPAAR